MVTDTRDLDLQTLYVFVICRCFILLFISPHAIFLIMMVFTPLKTETFYKMREPPICKIYTLQNPKNTDQMDLHFLNKYGAIRNLE